MAAHDSVAAARAESADTRADAPLGDPTGDPTGALPDAPIKIGFVLLSPSSAPLPSTRIAALNMFPLLREAGFDPQIVFEPAQPLPQPSLNGLAQQLIGQGFSIVVLQKVAGPGAEQLARELRAAGIRTIWLVCDLIDPAMAACVDATVVVTNYLKSLYPADLQARIHVVHDGIERPEMRKSDWGSRPASRSHPLRAVLVTAATLDHIPQLGSPPPWLQIRVVGRYPPDADWVGRLRALRWRLAKQPKEQRQAFLRFVLNWRIRCMAWDAERVYELMRQADVAIIPIETVAKPVVPGTSVPDWKVRSENRLTMKMALGLPVVATPIPSYEPVIEPGVTGFFARTRSEWLEQLDALREPTLRARMGGAARASVLERYAMREQARRLIEVLRPPLA